MTEPVRTLEIIFKEDGYQTRADARLRSGGREVHGVGRAKRNPTDPEMPAVGEELAAARALSEVAHKLVHQAAEAIEAFEGHRVELRT